MKKLNCVSVIMVVMAGVGIVCSFVSFFVPWFAFNTEIKSCRYGLFDYICEIDFPIPLLYSFVFITFFFTLCACTLFFLYALNVIKIKRIYLIVCVVSLVFIAIITFIFTIVIAKQYSSQYVGVPLMGRVIPSMGVWFLLLGTIMTCISLILVCYSKVIK